MFSSGDENFNFKQLMFVRQWNGDFCFNSMFKILQSRMLYQKSRRLCLVLLFYEPGWVAECCINRKETLSSFALSTSKPCSPSVKEGRELSCLNRCIGWHNAFHSLLSFEPMERAAIKQTMQFGHILHYMTAELICPTKQLTPSPSFMFLHV